MSEPSVVVRLLASVGALACGVGAIALVAVLAHRTPGAVSAAPAAAAPSTPASTDTFPAPPKNAVVFSRQLGDKVLALGVVPGKTATKAQVSVLDGQGKGVRGLTVRIGERPAAACGAGCYARTLPTARPQAIDVEVGSEAWHVSLPKQWPPQPASALLARATRVYRDLRTLVIDDHLASDAKHAVDTVWTIEAPDKLRYEVKNGPAAIIIGTKRWDTVAGGKWQSSNQTRLSQPTPFWKTWANAFVLDGTKTAWRVSFFDPKTPGWYELTIDKRSLRTLEMRMFAEAHFMHDRYSGFNRPVAITPPS
jgi:hypothetical protein